MACLFLLLSRPCYANGIVPQAQYYLITFIVFMIVGPLIESFLIIHFFLKKKAVAGHEINIFYFPLIVINFITFIIAQALVKGLQLVSETHNAIYLAEIFPLVSEFALFYWLFNRGYRNEVFTEPFSVKKVMVISVVANLLTFAMGIIVTLMFAFK